MFGLEWWRIAPRRRLTKQDDVRTDVYLDTVFPIERILQMSARSTYPWTCSPSFSRDMLAPAIQAAIRTPGSVVSVPVPLWRRIRGTPYPDTFAVSVEQIPGSVQTFIFAATSDSAGVLVANLTLAIRMVGGRGDELVKSWERRAGFDSGVFMHAIACIPGSVKG